MPQGPRLDCAEAVLENKLAALLTTLMAVEQANELAMDIAASACGCSDAAWDRVEATLEEHFSTNLREGKWVRLERLPDAIQYTAVTTEYAQAEVQAAGVMGWFGSKEIEVRVHLQIHRLSALTGSDASRKMESVVSKHRTLVGRGLKNVDANIVNNCVRASSVAVCAS